MKIVLGTANFYHKYGFLKKKIKNSKEIKNILSFIKRNKINYIDTASSYVTPNKLHSTTNFKQFKIITKIKLPQKSQEFFVNNLENLTKHNLKILNLRKFDSILLHNVYDLRTNIGKNF